MASVSNAFDALQNGAPVSSKKKKRKGKKPQTTSVEVPLQERTVGPRPVPSAHQLESQAAETSHDIRLELWERWATELLDEMNSRRGPYVDDAGKPTLLRSALLASRAFETLAESCVDVPLSEDGGNLLYRFLKAAFPSMDAEILQQLVVAIVKVSTLSRGKGPEVVFASKRALRDVMAAVKRNEAIGSDASHVWKKKASTRPDKSSISKKPHRQDKKAEFHDALEMVKYQQSAIDELDDEAIGSVGSASASRSISDLQVALSLATRPSEEVTVTSKRGKKNRNKSSGSFSSPMLDSLKQEEAAYAAEEARLNEEISGLEMKLNTLRSQLSSLHVSRQHVQQRKEAILHSLSTGQSNGTAAVIKSEEQSEAIGCLETVVQQMQSAVGQSDAEKREFALGYVDALEKIFSLCFARQDDLTKTVKFLKDSIHRRLEQEEKMKEITSAALTKDFLKTQQNSKHELEQQLRDALFESGDLMLKVTRIDTDFRQRSEFIRRYAPASTIGALENAAVRIKNTHHDIRTVAEEKREVTVQMPEVVKEPETVSRPRIDTKEIIKEAESKARAEIAAQQQQKLKSKKSVSSQGDVFSPEAKDVAQQRSSPLKSASHTQARHGAFSHEVEDPRLNRDPPHVYSTALSPPQTALVDPEVRHPIASLDPPPGPVQRPPPPAVPSGSTKRMAWKKIEDQSASGGDQPDLPTPGEARKQGKL